MKIEIHSYDLVVLKKWYTIYKDHITLQDYEIHDGMNLELYYQSIDTWWLFLQEQKIHAPHSWLEKDIWLAKSTGLCGMLSTWGWFACAFAILLN